MTADRRAQQASESHPGDQAAAEEQEQQEEAALAAGPHGGEQPPPPPQQQQAEVGPLEQGPGGPDWLPRLPPGFTELQHVDHVAVGVYLASCSSRQFGCFFQPDTPGELPETPPPHPHPTRERACVRVHALCVCFVCGCVCACTRACVFRQKQLDHLLLPQRWTRT